MVLAEMEISGTTRLAGVLGWPIAHSLSPALHNAAFEATGFDAVSVGLGVEPAGLRSAIEGLRALGAVGMSVTMPHKQAVLALADETTPEVRRLGAANCLTVTGGRLVASSTDGQGCLDALSHVADFSPEGRLVLLIGAGGAAAAIGVALAGAGARVGVLARRSDQANSLCSLIGAQAFVAGAHDVGGADLVVNATPVGMVGTQFQGLMPVPTGALHEGQVIFDTVYAPRETPLLAAAAQVGAVAVSGLAMLVHQAKHQLEGWIGQPVPLEALWSAVGGEVQY